jgi:hypothetical protein
MCCILKKILSFFRKPAKQQPLFPTEIEVKQIEPQDGEVFEEWLRVCSKEHQDLHSVYAAKIDDEEYPWQLTFSAGEFMREEPFASELSKTITEAIMSVHGAEFTHHDDTEKFIVSGTVSGKELIEKASAAIDTFMLNNLEAWEAIV